MPANVCACVCCSLLAHDRFQEGVTDPQFIYANRHALRAWEASWDELIGLPSRLSAVPDAEVQAERQALLDQAAGSGVIKDYAGWRVSTKGRKFRIKGVTLFNIHDMDGAPRAWGVGRGGVSVCLLGGRGALRAVRIARCMHMHMHMYVRAARRS